MLQSMGLQRVRHNLATKQQHVYIHMCHQETKIKSNKIKSNLFLSFVPSLSSLTHRGLSAEALNRALQTGVQSETATPDGSLQDCLQELPKTSVQDGDRVPCAETLRSAGH